MNETWFYIVWPIFSYLFGSISNGELIARAAGVNIRDLGTGNPGAANIWRQIGPQYGVAVFMLDLGKGLIVTLPLTVAEVADWVAFPTVVAMMLGQFFPIFFGFRGNTGMAALMGCTLGLLPFGGLIATPIGMSAILLTRNTGWVGLFIFMVALGTGGVLHQSPLGVAAVIAGGATVFVRGLIQYRIRSLGMLVRGR